MNQDSTQKHEFALFYDQPFQAGGHITIDDTYTVHRIARVLRLHTGNTLILFNETHFAYASITRITPKAVSASLLNVQPIMPITPTITVGLPLLKTNHLEEALYNATELGANHIDLIFTQKSRRSWNEKTEGQRLKRIMIGAAEQSKNFCLPTLSPPIAYKDWLHNTKADTLLVFLDPTGASFFDLITSIHDNVSKKITLLLGPEGDLTQEEKILGTNKNFQPYALGTTILRAHQALTIAIGTLRATL